MLYCNTATIAATRRAGAGLGALELGRPSGGGRMGAGRTGRWAQERAAGQRQQAWGARAASVAGARGRRMQGAGARGVQAAGVLGNTGARGEAGHAAWACLCAWWPCWLGQLGQFRFW